jgi:hypothetical protein
MVLQEGPNVWFLEDEVSGIGLKRDSQASEMDKGGSGLIIL